MLEIFLCERRPSAAIGNNLSTKKPRWTRFFSMTSRRESWKMRKFTNISLLKIRSHGRHPRPLLLYSSPSWILSLHDYYFFFFFLRIGEYLVRFYCARNTDIKERKLRKLKIFQMSREFASSHGIYRFIELETRNILVSRICHAYFILQS